MLEILAPLVSAILCAAPTGPPELAEARDPADAAGRVRLRVSWGHESAARRPFHVALELRPETGGSPAPLAPADIRGLGLEEGEVLRGLAVETVAGGGDEDGLHLELDVPARPPADPVEPHEIWAYLLARSDPETVRRLRQDPAFAPDPRTLTVRTDRDGLRGFTVTVRQLLAARAIWVPSLDVYLAAAAAGAIPPEYEAHRERLAAAGGRRILERARLEPEATYEGFATRWEDMGSPAYRNPAQVGPGHIVCLAWDGSLAKFGVDRGAGVWNDYGNPDRFRLWLDGFEADGGLARAWKGQRLEDGLPVMVTSLEQDGVRHEVEQLAFPLRGPPPERRGDIGMVLLERIRLSDLEGRARTRRLALVHERETPETSEIRWVAHHGGGVLEDAAGARALLAVEAVGARVAVEVGGEPKRRRATIAIDLEVPAGGAGEILVKLPSPPVPREDRSRLLGLRHEEARASTIAFWNGWLEKGALFSVPDETVNALFRASLWHALRLPRRHGGVGPDAAIDLPYSNFAYDQRGTPWPVNQAVYVDSMLHDLRGYHEVSAEELGVMYRNNQEPDGRVGGFANWGVYTPGMVWSSGRHFLLSGDRQSFERLLPPTLKALDWCLGELRRAEGRPGSDRGLVLAPLNDLSHDARAWAFHLAYFHGAFDVLGQALERLGHPRGGECLAAAATLRRTVEDAFSRAAVLSPAVELRDGTWSPYVPTDASTPRRLLDVWYPTDVDTGPAHLPRLEAIDPRGFLADCILADHEDNLFLGGLGMANEPVYNQHATAYLLRDDVVPAIRAFRSMTACAFSHSVLEPVEHRWGWGQYFGPPSTDGAWFDLYRRMLIHELRDGSLVLLQATPRRWLEDGKRISIRRAPTVFGTLSLEVESHAGSGELRALVDLEPRWRPTAILLRFRHPESRRIREATVDGAGWMDFDPEREWVRIPDPPRRRHEVLARY